MEGQYSRGSYNNKCYKILYLIKWETLGNLEHLEISEMGLTYESMFHFLSSMNRKLRYLCIRSIHYEVHSIVPYRFIQMEKDRIQSEGSFQIDLKLRFSTNHTASSEHQFENNQFMSLMEKNSGFPELRYFRFEDREFWDSGARVFQYCCEKSPKLEEIHFVDYRSDQQIIENVSKSIGSLASRLGWFTAYFTEWLELYFV